MERYQEYVDEKTAEDKKILMQSFWRDIQKIGRRYWDTFAVADFYNEMIAAYGDRWKCVLSTRLTPWTYGGGLKEWAGLFHVARNTSEIRVEQN